MATVLYESYYGIMPLTADYVKHYQVKGAKHHVRRYQNYDGSLTPLGREHYGVGEARDKVRTDKDRTDDGRIRPLDHTEGMHHNVRRYMNPDGSLTKTGAKEVNRRQKETLGSKIRNFQKDLAEGRQIAKEERAQAKAERQAARAERADAKAKERIAKIVNSADPKLIAKNVKNLSLDQLREANEKVKIVTSMRTKLTEAQREELSQKRLKRKEALDALEDTAGKGLSIYKKIRGTLNEFASVGAENRLKRLELDNKIDIIKDEIRKRREAPLREQEKHIEEQADKQYKREQDRDERDWQRRVKLYELNANARKADLERYDKLNERDYKRSEADKDRAEKQEERNYQRGKELNERDYQRSEKEKDRELERYKSDAKIREAEASARAKAQAEAEEERRKKQNQNK